MTRTKKQIIIQALILVTVAALLGFSVNSIRPNGLPLFQEGQGPTMPGIKKVDLAGARQFFDQGVLFIDSRSAEEYKQGHVKGAVNLPYEEFEDHYPEILGDLDLETDLVVYCSGEDCHSSDILADRILDEGFMNIYVFFGGWPAWVKAGYPTSEIKPRPLYTLE